MAYRANIKDYILTSMTRIRLYKTVYQYILSSRKGESCCHVGALLLYMIDLKARRCTELPTDKTCASQLSQWTVPGNLSSKKLKKDVPLDQVIIAKPRTIVTL
jgi:hypothetical protein